jgi:hypothetical protein
VNSDRPEKFPARRTTGTKRLLALVTLFCAVMAGCGPRGPDVQLVEGFVTLDGSPCAGAIVGFSPVVGGVPATGRTGLDGSYRITAVRGGRERGGTTVGEYLVTIDKMELLPPPPNPLGQQLEPEFRYIVPKAYGDQTTSGLKATVRRGLNSGPEFRFDLRSDFQPPASETPKK